MDFEAKQAYISNLFLDKASCNPTIILNWENEDEGAYEVLDGKQRISTIIEFINNEFSIKEDKYFKDLSRTDCFFILYGDVRYTRIEKINMKNLTLKEKIELFLEVNELGTKMSDEHIAKVKHLI